VLPISAASVLTPGEYVAASQVLSSGRQSIVLGGAGASVGGSFVLTPQLSQNINNLVVPSGVTAIANAALLPTLHLSGDLTNSGNFYAVSTNPQFSTFTIQATNIFNQPGGLLTSVVPKSGLPGFSGLVSNVHLNLNAVQNIVNAGTISSSGNLTAS